MHRWNWLQGYVRPVALLRLNLLSRNRRRIWLELFNRFAPLFGDVLQASGCDRDRVEQELTICCVRLIDLSVRDPKLKCMPLLMFQACTAERVLAVNVAAKLKVRFHLRALLDEIAPSDARAAVRFFVFATRDEISERKSTQQHIGDLYGHDKRLLLTKGLDLLAKYLFTNRSKLKKLTAGDMNETKVSSESVARTFVNEFLIET